MGLSASMWTSVSGLLAHGNKMNVVGNNIANVSTIGFKGQRMDFNDYLYIGGGSTSGPTQIGAGVSTYAVLGDFSQGSLESTNSVTDLAIDGNGFFKVRQPNTNQMYYTRAGDFYFNADRQLQNPEGYRLQGWKVDGESKSLRFMSESINLGKNTENESAFVGTGTPKDIVLDSWYLTPKRTDSVSFTMGLVNDTSKNDRAKPTTGGNVGSALFDSWNASDKANPPIADQGYATSSSIKVYDEGGNSHEMSVYYDQVSDYPGVPSGYTVYEYIVTVPPEEDMRFTATYNDDGSMSDVKKLYNGYDDPDNPTAKNAGVLMTGHLIFDSSGVLINQTAYTWNGSAAADANGNAGIDNSDNWVETKYSSNGLPVMAANFTGKPHANSVFDVKGKDEAGNMVNVEDYMIEIDFGLRNLAGGPATSATADTAKKMVDAKDYDSLAKFDDVHRTDNSSTAASSSFVTQDAGQNGYASGILSGTNITNDGVVYGYYDNGETIPLYQIALYDFHNHQGLRREGGNLYAATKESGEARQGVAGDNGFGVTRAYNIEGSNVDMSREFVNMITTQRGFQANSKGITTVDTMLETVIGMKR